MIVILKKKRKVKRRKWKKLKKLYKETLMMIQWHDSETEKYDWKLNDKEIEWLDIKTKYEDQLKPVNQIITKIEKEFQSEKERLNEALNTKTK